MTSRHTTMWFIVPLVALLVSCGAPAPAPEPEGETLENGLLLSLAVLKTDEDGRPEPQPAQLGILTQTAGEWSYRSIIDEDSNVFHKAMVWEPRAGEPGILTAGGTAAVMKQWPVSGTPATLWQKDFGGKFSRMRDVEAGDLYGDGSSVLAVATHDQGVVAVIKPAADGAFEVQELDHDPNTFVHEIEIGDLDNDGVLEVYATPSLPNKLDGTPQPGSVVRYVPATGEGRVVVADLGDRHAKEILVDDVDGDGIDELYVSVEAVAGGQVEIVRYDAGTEATGGTTIATLEDKLCRFLTAGDVDGDGVKEMVAAAHKSGLWLLRPGADATAAWELSSIDRDSAGFEHASILADLDGDGVDELYVANDKGKDVNRYTWENGQPVKELLFAYSDGFSRFTWNVMPVPIALIPEGAD